MPVTNPFQGEAGQRLRNSRWSQIQLAPRGVAFGATAMVKGVRDSLTLEIKPGTTPHVIGGLISDNFDIVIKGRFLETTFARLHAMYMLIKDFHQVRLLNQNGEYWSFVDDPAIDFDAPEGTELVGATMKFTIEPKARYIDYEGKTQLTRQQMAYLVDNFGVAHIGSTGGATVSASGTEEYDRDEYAVPNFDRIAVGDGGALDIDQSDIGIFRDGKLEMSFEGNGTDDHKGRPIPTVCKIRGEALMLQTSGPDILAGVTAGQKDKVTQFFTMNGEEVRLNLSASVHTEGMFGDKEMNQKVIVQGDAPFNVNEGAPNSIDIGVTDPKKLIVNRIGY
jgi:hypothetical protein